MRAGMVVAPSATDSAPSSASSIVISHAASSDRVKPRAHTAIACALLSAVAVWFVLEKARSSTPTLSSGSSGGTEEKSATPSARMREAVRSAP